MSLREKLRSSGKLQTVFAKEERQEKQDEVQQEKFEREGPKSKKKNKESRYIFQQNDENDVKQEQQQAKILKKRSKQKREKHKSKKSRREQTPGKIKKQKQSASKKHKKKSKNKKISKEKSQSESMQQQDYDKIEAIDVQLIKFQQQEEEKSVNTMRKKQFVSREDSQRIIYLFSLDAGDYKGLRQQLPHMQNINQFRPQKNIRNHLRVLFQHCLDRIIQRVKISGRKIKEWQPFQRRQIVRQLHRIRSSNRLLSQGNIQLRETFHKMMKTYNNSQILMTDQQITFLYRKIEAFVRGFNQLNFFRKNYYVPPDQQDQRRKPIIDGGYILQHKIKRQFKKTQKFKPKVVKIDPQKLIRQWTQLQERELCILYLDDKNYQFIIENLRAKFGDSDKWKDFQILGKKIDHIIKLGLNRLQELTMKPYNRLQKMMQEYRRAKIRQDLKKRINKPSIDKMDDFKEIIYTSQHRQIKEGGLIKNPSLLLKQVFAHHGQSFRVKYALAHLLVQKYPQQQQIQKSLKIIKDFTEWADRQQQTNHVTMIRARLPVIDDGTKSKTFSMGQSDDESAEQRRRKDEAEIAQGLTMIQDEEDQELMKRQAEEKLKFSNQYFVNGKFDFDSNSYVPAKSQKSYQRQNQSMLGAKSEKSSHSLRKKQTVIQVFESQQSQYEGFISQHTAKQTKI